MRRLCRVERGDSLAATYDRVRYRPEFEIRRDTRIDTDVHETAAGPSRQKPFLRICVRNRDDSGFVQRMPEPFVIPKEKHSVAFDRSAQGSAVRVAVERGNRRGRPIEIILGVHRAIAHEVVSRAMELIRSRFGHSVHHGAVAPVLGAVRVGQDLKLRDRINAHRRADDTRS